MSVESFPKKKKMETMIDALFQCLPASSHKEIAQAISKQLGYGVKPSYVGTLLTYLRGNVEEFQWTVPLAKRGRHTMDEEGNRFFHVLVESEKEPFFDAEHKAQLNAGLVSTISHAASSMEHEAEALDLSIPYCQEPTTQKWLRSYARRTRQMAEDAQEVVEMLKSNGS